MSSRLRAVLLLMIAVVAVPIVAGTTYAPVPAGFSLGNQIKLKIDLVGPKALIRKNDDQKFLKPGTLYLYMNGVQIGSVKYDSTKAEFPIPFSWSFTSGSRTFTAKAYSSDLSVFESGSVTVTATTTGGAPTISTAAVLPTSGVQNRTLFRWTATVTNATSVTLWIVRPNGEQVAFGMTPSGTDWRLDKTLLATGAYQFYVTATAASGQSVRYPPTGTKPNPSTIYLVAPRMGGTTSHVSVHLYRNPDQREQLRQYLRIIRSTALGTSEATCVQSGGRSAQLAVQLEFPFSEYVNRGETAFLNDLDETIKLVASEGFALHLLLSVHYRPDVNKRLWNGADFNQTWPGAKKADKSDSFVPYQPTKERGTGKGPYDVISEKFHDPVLRHLAANSDLYSKVAVVYLLNEFDYATPRATDEVWPCTTSQPCRNEALAYTTQRFLGNGRLAAGGRIPVGVKLASALAPYSAFYKGTSDQLAYLLNTVMGPSGTDVLGFDAYWNSANLYDGANYTRFRDFLGAFNNGRLEIAEYGRICDTKAATCVNTASGRTSKEDIRGLATTGWKEARGFNLFAFNGQGCYVIHDGTNFCSTGGQAELAGLWEQFLGITGSTAPQPCQ
ncbi:MAG: hypothetical protein ABI779_15870 [Acidobacteriota bacterium]